MGLFFGMTLYLGFQPIILSLTHRKLRSTMMLMVDLRNGCTMVQTNLILEHKKSLVLLI